jgi:hypothetical protein
MATPDDTVRNDPKLNLLEKALADLLALALRRGYHGTVGVEVSIQDGAIQHIRQRLERIDR